MEELLACNYCQYTDFCIKKLTRQTLQTLQVITGPNGSGKSCLARQVALITFLAHVGSFVPADEARIGVADRIFTRVASRECAAVPQSTFAIDLSQVAGMLRAATPRSVCVVDEFGKGTLAADGVGLLCAALRRLSSASPVPPRVLLCTHFTEVLAPEHLPRTPMITFGTMSVLLEEGEADRPADGGELVFLYRLVPGRVMPSFGLHCARLAGIKSVRE
jgi:DNA mismatch repair protein MSH5